MSNLSNMNLDRMPSWRKLVQSEIDSFLSDLREVEPEKLDYSLNSLDLLEKWLLETYLVSATNSNASKTIIPEGVMYYVGEVYRKHLGDIGMSISLKPNLIIAMAKIPLLKAFLRM